MRGIGAGAIQPCAWLLGFAQDWSISHASANCARWLGSEASALLGRPAHAAIAGEALHEIRSRAQVLGGVTRGTAERIAGLDLGGDGQRVDATLQVSEHGWLLSCEAAARQRDHMGTALRMAAGLRGAATLADLCAAAARDVRALTGFHRVQVLRFVGGGATVVLGESAGSAAASFAPLMFSDADHGIGQLFSSPELRLIADWQANAVVVLGRDDAIREIPASGLAAARPGEAAALAAIGARAMVSLPLLRGGQHWGAIACCHVEPRLVPFPVRPALELLAMTLGLLVEIAEPGQTRPVDRDGGVASCAPPLSGRALVVEDNMLIAMEAEEVVQELGAEACDVAGSVAAAMRLIKANHYDFALLDIELGSETSEAVARALASRGVRFVYASGYGGTEKLAPGFPPAPGVIKPYGGAELTAAIRLAR